MKKVKIVSIMEYSIADIYPVIKFCCLHTTYTFMCENGNRPSKSKCYRGFYYF